MGGGSYRARELSDRRDLQYGEREQWTTSLVPLRGLCAVTATKDLLASVELTDRLEPDVLQRLLCSVSGPVHLADDPVAFAREWSRLNDLDARRPPFVPRRPT
jgi:hypothetical protein